MHDNEEGPPERAASNPDRFQVGWQRVAVALLILLAAALATLVAITATKNVDILATVALFVAIVAFGAQLVTFVAQNQSANMQMLQAERVNTDTRSALVEIRAISQAVLQTLSNQVQPILDSVVGQVTGAVAKATGNTELTPDEIRREVESTTTRALKDFFDSNVSSARTLLSPSRPTSLRTEESSYEPPGKNDPIVKRLQTYPTEEEAETSVELLRQMPPMLAATFAQLARIEKVDRMFDRAEGRFRDSRTPTVRGLLNLGLLEEAEPPPDKKPKNKHQKWVRLSNKGIELARLFEGEGPYPSWLLPLVTPPSENEASQLQ